MKDTPPHLQALEEVERAGIPGLLEVLREEGIDGVRYALWDATGWHRDYSPPAWRNRASTSTATRPLNPSRLSAKTRTKPPGVLFGDCCELLFR